MNKSNRNARLDALRGIAILLVLGVHFHFYPPEGSFIAWISLTWRRIGPVGVVLFFVLSGFLIGSLLVTEMKRHSEIKVGRFLIRRGFKLYPVYYLFLAYCGFVPVLKALPAGGDSSTILRNVGAKYLASFVFLQNYIPPNPAGHTWSLAVEEQFYLVLPFLIAFLGPRRVWSWLIPICLSAVPVCALLRTRLILHQQACGGVVLESLSATHLHVDALMLGVALAVTAVKYPDRFIQLGRFPKTLVMLGFLLWAVPYLASFSMLWWAALGSTLWLVGSAAILVGVCSLKGTAGNRRGLLAWIGACSYAIYVWHVTVIGSAEKYVVNGFLTGHIDNGPLRWIVSVIVAVPLCVLVGALVTRIIESPSLRLRDRLFPSRGHAITLPDQKMGETDPAIPRLCAVTPEASAK
jgi:peptidoglycan/LPS O-acetylase OafA/YrhL